MGPAHAGGAQGRSKKKVKDVESVHVHFDRLLSALNKFWRPLPEDEYWHDMDSTMTNNAITCAQFPKEITEWVFEIKRKPFTMIKGK